MHLFVRVTVLSVVVLTVGTSAFAQADGPLIKGRGLAWGWLRVSGRSSAGPSTRAASASSTDNAPKSTPTRGPNATTPL